MPTRWSRCHFLVALLALLPMHTTHIQASSAAGPGPLTWTALPTTGASERAPSWYNLAVDGQGRFYWYNWNGELWRLDPPSGTRTKVAQWHAANLSAHNCTITYDPIANRVRLTGVCNPGSARDEPRYRTYYFDVGTGESGTDVPTRGGPDSAGVYDPVGKRLLAFGGWLASITYYPHVHVLPLQPPGSWQTVAGLNPAPAPSSECDRLAHNRTGFDTRRNRYWIIMSDGNLWTGEGGATGWTKRPTTGERPNVCTIYTYDARLDRIVAWTGLDAVTGGAGAVVQKTRLLHPDTLVWTEEATATTPPPHNPTINAMAYDHVRGQTILRTAGNFWALRGANAAVAPTPSAPAPPVFALSVAVTGQGTVVGPGSYRAGQSVALNATPAVPGSTVQWTGPAPCPRSTAASAMLVMPEGALSCAVAISAPAAPSSLSSSPNDATRAQATETTPTPRSTPPTGGALDLPARTFVARPLPSLAGAPFRSGSKHTRFVWNPVDGRIYNFGGDWSYPGRNNSYVSAVFSYGVKDNDWREEHPYCAIGTGITPDRPDQGTVAFDTRRRRYLIGGAYFGPPGGICEESNSQYTRGLLAFPLATKLFERVRPAGLNGFAANYDSAADEMLHVVNGGCTYEMWHTRVSDGTVTRKSPVCTSTRVGAAGTYFGNAKVHVDPWAWDDVGRKGYLIAWVPRFANGADTRSDVLRAWEYNAASGKLRQLPDPPVPAGYWSRLDATPTYWDSVNRRVLVPFSVSYCGEMKGMGVFDPATDTWESFPVVSDPPGLVVRANSGAFDSGQNVMMLGGSVFWGLPGEGCPQIKHPPTHVYLWRYR